MASVSIMRRESASGPRFRVRYRLGGRAWPLVDGGSFSTQREARIRRDVIAGELAAGRDPAEALQALLAAPVQRRTFAAWADPYKASRVDVSPATRRGMETHLKRLVAHFGTCDPAAITPDDVQAWITACTDFKPGSLRTYLLTLRQLLDYAGAKPNPSRDARVRLPRAVQAVVEPPSAEQVEAIIANVKHRWRLPLRVLEQSGMRVGELAALEWRDVDVASSRFRMRQGKTAAARRWVAVPAWLMVEVQATCAPDDRTPERRVFHGFTPGSCANVMRRACTAAGIPHYSPHGLRHRYASIKVREGVPVTDLAAQLGHSKKSLTLDTYSHVLLDEPAV
jgi:integrase